MANLLNNGGFDQAGGKAIQGWTLSAPVASRCPAIAIDPQSVSSGTGALKMRGNADATCYGKLVQSFAVEGGATYAFTGKLKLAPDISVSNCIIAKIIWYRDQSADGMNYLDGYEPGTGDWIDLKTMVTAPPEANRGEVHLGLRWTDGAAWFDDLNFSPAPKPPERSVRVGTVYYYPEHSSLEENIQEYGRLLDEAGRKRVDIVCLPESFAVIGTPISWSRHPVNQIPGPATELLSRKARDNNMYIVAGVYSWEGDNLYNVALLYDRDGKIAGKYRKVHLPDTEAEAGIIPGTDFPVFQTDFGTIGIYICWDHVFPESARALALKGAEIIFCPIMGDIRGWDYKSPITEQEIWKLTSRARAIDNGVFFVGSINHGHSLIVDPGGRILVETKDRTPSMLSTTITLDNQPKWKWLGAPGPGDWKTVWRKDRRPEAYEELTR